LEQELQIFAENIRLASLRAVAAAGGGHLGGIFSMAEALAVLYGDVMRVNPRNPAAPERDKLVLSKGHCGPGLFAALALKGFFPLEDLLTLNQNGTLFPSHCDRQKTPGVDMTTGSLGQGASSAAGIALADQLARRAYRTFLILGDGELDEGQVWEMALFARQRKLRNLVALVDLNGQQLDGDTRDICAGVANAGAMFASFGWNMLAVDGHSVREIHAALQPAAGVPMQPTAIILKTIKGRGWSRLEGKPKVHHSVVDEAQLREAEAEITRRIASLQAAV
jgi:transketolase